MTNTQLLLSVCIPTPVILTGLWRNAKRFDKMDARFSKRGKRFDLVDAELR